MSAFYSDAFVTVIHGDAREEVRRLATDPAKTVVVTDPVWPNAPKDMFHGIDDAATLLRDVAVEYPRIARRAVVILGCMSDPRFLAAMPAVMPFVRVCWLRYALPSYAGTILNSGDVAYVFGDRQACGNATLISGEITSARSTRNTAREHPCPRNMDHMLWVIGTLTNQEDTVVDTFGGSGSTAEAAKKLGRKCIIIEREEKYCDLIVRRVRQEAFDFSATENSG